MAITKKLEFNFKPIEYKYIGLLLKHFEMNLVDGKES